MADIADNAGQQKVNKQKEKQQKEFSHLDEQGKARMVDVTEKDITQRVASASAIITMQTDTLSRIQDNEIKKGDVLAVARVAGIQAAKKCSDLIPLCHPLALSSVEIEFAPDIKSSNNVSNLRVMARCKLNGQTGVEMEALTAVSVAALTIYDMCKAVDKGMVISELRLLEKSGGKSGDYRFSTD